MSKNYTHAVSVTALNILDGMHHIEYWDKLEPMWANEGMGFDGFCGWITEIAEESERILAERNPQDFPGVYDYEVSYDMGVWIRRTAITHGTLPSPEKWKAMLNGLVDKFFRQGE